MYYDTSTDIANPNLTNPAILPHTSIAASQSTSHENTENTLRQPNKAKQDIKPASVFDITLEHLRKSEFDEVMSKYPNIQSKLSESDAIKHKKLIIDHVQLLSKSGQSITAHALLTLYLKHEYRDVPALLLMAKLYQDSGNEMEAIEVLFQAKSYAHTPELIKQTVKAIRSAVKNYNTQLLIRKDYIAQLNLYKRLTELEPEYALHFIGLAETYLSLGNVFDARKALDLTLHDSSVLDKRNDIVSRLEINIEPNRHYATEVSLQAFGNQFLVDVLLNNSQNAVLLLDTGASLSIISTELLAVLAIPYQHTIKTAWFSTAGGRIKAPIIKLNSIAMNEVVVENIEVGVIGEFDNKKFDGLLGMNFLRYFEFFIDQNEHKLQLSPR
jgi:clan AA aspartic protease (TIGR02281 family)